jgi:hypothetical protein
LFTIDKPAILSHKVPSTFQRQNLKSASDKSATKDYSNTIKNVQGKVYKYFLSKNKTASDTSLKLSQQHLVLKCQLVPATFQRQNRKKTVALVAGK